MAGQSLASAALTAQVVSPFPLPPSYAQNYTKDLLEAGKSLPPPQIPNDFIVFGEEYHFQEEIIRPLPVQNIRQLYTSKYDWKSEMKKLNKSVVAAFLDLLDILTRCPEHVERIEKLNDIRDIFINIHHLINEFRPIQARDTLILMQEKQLHELEETLSHFSKFVSQTKRALKTSLSEDPIALLPVPPRRPDLEELVEEAMEEQNTEPELKKQQLNRPQISRRRTLAEEMYELEL